MADQSSEPPVLTERRDNVLVITLNRPEVRNAVNKEVSRRRRRGARRARRRRRAGDRRADRSGQRVLRRAWTSRRSPPGQTPWHETRGFAGIVKQPPNKPIIAAVEGFAVAGGLEVALACDLLVAAAGAKLGIPEVKRSLIAAGGALRRLPRKLPAGIAMELALTGEPISAERGYELGLVNRIAEPGSAVDVALELATAIAKQRPARARGDQADPRSRSGTGATRSSGSARARSPARCSCREDAREGAIAFGEKREPVWKGQ